MFNFEEIINSVRNFFFGSRITIYKDPARKTITIADAANRYGLAKRAMYNMRYRKRKFFPKSFKRNGRIVYFQDELDLFFQEIYKK